MCKTELQTYLNSCESTCFIADMWFENPQPINSLWIFSFYEKNGRKPTKEEMIEKYNEMKNKEGNNEEA